MFIQYGINEHGELVYIDQVPRGATALKCPYCGGVLLAKKGEIKAPHFAHAAETCAAVRRDQDAIALPAYDNFNLHLPGKAIMHLQEFAKSQSDLTYKGQYDEHYLHKYKLLEYNEYKRRVRWELSKKGKLVLGQLSLMLFNDFQETLLLDRYNHLHRLTLYLYRKPTIEAEIKRLESERERLAGISVYDDPEARRNYYKLGEKLIDLRTELDRTSPSGMDLQTAIADLRLYTAQWRRILTTTLYFLRIGGIGLYKIGVTTRPIQERVAEIKTDLLPHYGNIEIEVLDTWEHRGNIELYFKYRYKGHRTLLGNLTEYYTFDEVKPVLLDLRRMKDKKLTDLERSILAGEPAPIELQMEADRVEAQRQQTEDKRRRMISMGMKKARSKGKPIGRPQGQESRETFLSKPDSQRVIEALNSGLSLREVARTAGVALATVQKVKKMLE